MRKKIILLVISIGIGLVLAETSLQTLAVIVKYRRPETRRILSKNTFTILCVGDSVTYGVGTQPGKSFPAKLQEILSRDANMAITIINLAYPGASTAGTLQQLEQYLKIIKKPQLVIALTGGGNSLWNFKEMLAGIMKTSLSVREIYLLRLEAFFSNFKLYKLLKMSALNLKTKKEKLQSPEFKTALSEARQLKILDYQKMCSNAYFEKVILAYEKCIALMGSETEPYLGILDTYSFCNRKVDERALLLLRHGPSLDKRLNNLAQLSEPSLRILTIKAMTEDISNIINLCQNKKVPLLFLNYPSGGYIPMIDILRNQWFLDLETYFKQKLQCDRCSRYFTDSIHLNQVGYEIMAQHIADEIRKVFPKETTRLKREK